MGTFTPELTFGEYSYGTMAEDPGISYKTLIYSGFSPLSLFAASEPGFWFDPSDLSTLFQDAAGTTPVTAAGQSVGLVLDKSKGLVLGPELVTNGDFSGGSTGWTVPAGWSISSGQATATATSTSLYGGQFTPVTNRVYRVEFDVVSYTSGDLFVTVGGNFTSNVNLTGAAMAPGRKSVVVVAGASPARAVEFYGGTISATIDNISVRELPGNHATQSTSLSRPTYQVDSNGRGYLSFDGSDDFLVTPTITPGTDKVQVFAGVRKLSDAADGSIIGHGDPSALNNGSCRLDAPGSSTAAKYQFITRGTATSIPFTTSASFNAPVTNVLTGIGDIAADTAILRVNGAQAATSPNDQGTGNYDNYPVYIGRRGGTALPFNGHIYSLICRFGPNLTAEQIAQTEAWVNSKTGAY